MNSVLDGNDLSVLDYYHRTVTNKILSQFKGLGDQVFLKTDNETLAKQLKKEFILEPIEEDSTKTPKATQSGDYVEINLYLVPRNSNVIALTLKPDAYKHSDFLPQGTALFNTLNSVITIKTQTRYAKEMVLKARNIIKELNNAINRRSPEFEVQLPNLIQNAKKEVEDRLDTFSKDMAELGIKVEKKD